MDFDKYAELAFRTAPKITENQMIVNAGLGLCGESGEVAEVIKKFAFQGHDLDKHKIKEEVGDVLWYIAYLCKAMNISLGDIAQNNIDKLKKRYPEEFSAERSVNRDEY